MREQPNPQFSSPEKGMENLVKPGIYQHWKLDYPPDVEHAKDGNTRGLYKVLRVMKFDRSVDRKDEKIITVGNFSGVIKDIPGIGRVELIDIPEEYEGNLVIFVSLSGKPHFKDEGVVALARTEGNWIESGTSKINLNGETKDVTFENRFRPVNPNDTELIQMCQQRAKDLYPDLHSN